KTASLVQDLESATALPVRGLDRPDDSRGAGGQSEEAERPSAASLADRLGPLASSLLLRSGIRRGTSSLRPGDRGLSHRCLANGRDSTAKQLCLALLFRVIDAIGPSRIAPHRLPPSQSPRPRLCRLRSRWSRPTASRCLRGSEPFPVPCRRAASAHVSRRCRDSGAVLDSAAP